MQKQTVEFATVVKKGVVQRVGRTSIVQPKTNFKGGSIKWAEDKPRKDGANNGRYKTSRL